MKKSTGKPMMKKLQNAEVNPDIYDSILGDISTVIEAARRSAARSVNSIMTAVYWFIGHRIVEFEQGGKSRAGYGEELLERLAVDLTAKFGRGFSRRSLQDMRAFYLVYPPEEIWQTMSAKLLADTSQGDEITIIQTVSGITVAGAIKQTLSAKFAPATLAACFPLPWSAYVRLLSVKNEQARRFYESEALRGGWSVRQLDRQINAQIYERTALSRNKAAMLRKGEKPLPEDRVLPEEEI